MIIYCLKCKQKTETIEVQSVQSQNGRQMIKGNCSICGTKKSVFISIASATKPKKTMKGKGFSLNNLDK